VSTSQGTILRLYLYLDNTTTNTPGGKDTTPLNSSKFEVTIQGPEYFSVQVNRREEDTLIFSTSLGPTIACDDYWELALKFPDDGAVFGLGGLRLTTQNKLLYNSGHRLGANPFIMILDTEGQAHGILFNNRGPMEFKLLENSNILSVKSRSTVMWDISVFAGPNPASVMEQYTSIDGLRPILPPAWALGVHICRDTNRENGNLVADDAFYFLQNAAEIPYESDCLQEGLLYGLDFSISANMTKITEEFKKTGRKLLLSLPPHVSSTKVSALTKSFCTYKSCLKIRSTFLDYVCSTDLPGMNLKSCLCAMGLSVYRRNSMAWKFLTRISSTTNGKKSLVAISAVCQMIQKLSWEVSFSRTIGPHLQLRTTPVKTCL